MPKSNCQFNGTGGQYFATIIIHVLILGSITCGIYSSWAWVMVFRLKASHTMINGKHVTFTGTGGQLFTIALIHGLLTIVTFGFYGPWAICKFLEWKARNTLVDGKATEFAGSGGSLFILYLIHLMILPILTMGIYTFIGLYKLYAWKEENSRYGGEKTSFGGGLGGLFKVLLIGGILQAITMQLFLPWYMCMLYKWQISGLAVGDGADVEHFPPTKINPIVVIVVVVIGLLPLLAILWAGSKAGQDEFMKPPQVGMQTPSMKPAKKSSPPIAIPKAQKETPLAKKAKQSNKVEKPKTVNIDQEIKKIADFINKNSNNADAYYNRGVLYSFKDDSDQAIIDYSKAIEIDKDHGDAHYNRGLVYVENERYEEAIRGFSKAIKMAPGSVDALCNRGNVYYMLGKYKSAIKDYTAAIKRITNDADLYYNRSIAYRANGEERNANADAVKAAQLRGGRSEKGSEEKKGRGGKIGGITWKEDLSNVNIPETTAEGMIHGDPFVVESAKIENGILTIRDGNDFFPDHALMIFLFLKKGESAANKSFNINKSSGFSSPHIHMKWMPEGKKVPDTEMFTAKYVMRLNFGNMKDGKLPGKIYVCIPDKMKSYAAGSFIADMK